MARQPNGSTAEWLGTGVCGPIISFFALLLLSAFSDGFDRFGVIEIENICHLLRNNISVIGVI